MSQCLVLETHPISYLVSTILPSQFSLFRMSSMNKQKISYFLKFIPVSIEAEENSTCFLAAFVPDPVTKHLDHAWDHLLFLYK